MSCNTENLMSWTRGKGGCPLKAPYDKCHMGHCWSPAQEKCAEDLVKAYNKESGDDCSPSDSDTMLGLCKGQNGFNGGPWCGPGAEGYTATGNVCSNQADYNQAFRNAIKYNNKQNVKSMGGWIWVYLVLFLVFLFWAVMLAAKVQPGPYRTMHMVLALIFSPAYVLGHYLGQMNK